MLSCGLVRQSCSGIYHLLPLGQRAMDKLSLLVERAMASINASKMSMPLLTPAALWQRSGGIMIYHTPDLTLFRAMG